MACACQQRFNNAQSPANTPVVDTSNIEHISLTPSQTFVAPANSLAVGEIPPNADNSIAPVAPSAPGIIERGANLMAYAAQAINGSLEYADDATAARRLAICDACPNKAIFVCTKCGCILKAKTKIKIESCPEGKW